MDRPHKEIKREMSLGTPQLSRFGYPFEAVPTGQTSTDPDTIILSGEYRFNVHIDKLAAHSGLFSSAYRAGWRKSDGSVIALHDDDPVALAVMLLIYYGNGDRWIESVLESCCTLRVLEQAHIGRTDQVGRHTREILSREPTLELHVKVRNIALKFMSFDIAASVVDQYLYEVTKGRDLWSPSGNPFELAEHVFDDDLEFLMTSRADDQLIESVVNHLAKHWTWLRDFDGRVQSTGARAVKKWVAVRPWIVMKVTDIICQDRDELRGRSEWSNAC